MGTSRFAVLIACAAKFLVGADGLSVAIARPAIQRGLHADPLPGPVGTGSRSAGRR